MASGPEACGTFADPDNADMLLAAARAPHGSVRMVLAIAVIAAILSGCAAAPGHPQAKTSRALPRDPHTAAALLRIASVFNNDYDTGSYGPVYDRWDARSKAIISRASYIRRHAECPSAPATARVEGARPGPHGAWLVSYVIGGVQLTDYWFYSGGRWQFDLPLSNPSAVSLYEMPGKQYVAALGCSH